MNNFRKKALAIAIGSTAVLSGMSSAAYAQDGAIEEVLITGSRIKRPDFESSAPVSSLGVEQIQLTNTVNTESLLNTLPQAVPGLDNTSNNPGNGTATVNLRGLGSSRTLVLMDGIRVTPNNASGIVDINSIPNALIERIDVLTGGASAVYGSDAVAGVVNFVLKKDFEGVELATSYDITEENDAGLFSASITVGGNFDGGKGNMVMNFTHTDRDDLFQGDRDFANFAQFDSLDDSGNPILIDGGSSGVPQTSIFNGKFSTYAPDSSGIIFAQDGSIRAFETSGDENDYYNYAPVNYIQLPQKRNQATVLGHYDFAENHKVYVKGNIAASDVPTQLAPTPIFETSTFTLDDNPFISAAAQQTISDAIGVGVDTDGDGIDDEAKALVRRRLEEVGPRISNNSRRTYQLIVGGEGEIGDTGWSYDAYFSKGNFFNGSTQEGNVNRDRFKQALLVETDEEGNVVCQDTNANGSTIGCAPMNIFGQGNISEDAAAFLRTAVSATAEYNQNILSATLSGPLTELPGGELAMAAGIERIKESFSFNPSQDLAASTIAGFNGSPSISGLKTRDSIYMEVFAPVLDNLELEAAYRRTDYDTFTSDSYKLSGKFNVLDGVTVRGGYNRAVRAPSIGELFAPLSEGFPGSTDPCSDDAEGTVSAAVSAICVATGVAEADVGSPALDLPAGQVKQISGGNPNLTAEVADTITVGVVVDPMENLTFSLDYFDISIDDSISSFGGGANNVLGLCYDDANEQGADSLFCKVVTRRSDGTIDNIAVTTQNVAKLTARGFDLIASHDTELMGGELVTDFVATYTLENNLLPFLGADAITCAGKFGADCGKPIPEYKHRVSSRWLKDDISVALFWRYIGTSSDDDDDSTYFVEKLDSQNYFDTTVTYAVAENTTLSLGIKNLLDSKPPILGDNQAQANTFPSVYDVFGRRFVLGLRASF